MHALTAMTRQLRQGKGKAGLILANGGVLSYQHVVCLSREPRRDGKTYPTANPLPEVVDDVPVPDVAAQAKGHAVIEVRLPSSLTPIEIEADTTQTYTVEFGRDGKPTMGHIVGRLAANGHRFLANHADENTLKVLSSTTEEQIGKRGQVWTLEDGRNVFSFAAAPKL